MIGWWGRLRPSLTVVGVAGGHDWWAFRQASRGAGAGGVVVVADAGRWGQAGAGSALSCLNAAASSLAQGQMAGSRSVAVRAWNASRAATCSSR